MYIVNVYFILTVIFYIHMSYLLYMYHAIVIYFLYVLYSVMFFISIFNYILKVLKISSPSSSSSSLQQVMKTAVVSSCSCFISLFWNMSLSSYLSSFSFRWCLKVFYFLHLLILINLFLLSILLQTIHTSKPQACHYLYFQYSVFHMSNSTLHSQYFINVSLIPIATKQFFFLLNISVGHGNACFNFIFVSVAPCQYLLFSVLFVL